MAKTDSNGNKYKLNVTALDDLLSDRLETLNVEQKIAVNGLTEWFINWNDRHNQKQPAILDGFAGTGKSYVFSVLVLNIIKKLYYSGFIQYPDEFTLTLIAPSNAASEVMRDFSSEIGLWKFCNVRCTTVHAYSGVVMGELNENAEREQTWLERETEEDNSCNQLTIVDERGMIPDQLYKQKLANFWETPILYLGNLEQLPPIGNDDRKPGTSIVDEQHLTNYFALTETMRNTGSILEFSNQLLQQYTIVGLQYSRLVEKIVSKGLDPQFDLPGTDPINRVLLPFKTDDQTIVARRSEVLPELISDRIISSDFLDKPDNYFKVLCYTNAAVSEWNTLIRGMLFGEAANTIHVGEIFIVKAPIYDKSVEGKAEKIFFTNQRIKLRSIDLISYPLIDRLNGSNNCVVFPGISLEFYALTAINRYGREKEFLYPMGKTLRVLTKFFLAWWEIIDQQTNPVYRRNQYNHWEKTLSAYGLKYKETKKEQRSANKVPFTHLVMPDCGATVHSAQGMSFDNVVVDWDDIQKARGMDTRLRLSYVAASRASKRLWICTSDDLKKK
jgi:hypothetical protein